MTRFIRISALLLLAACGTGSSEPSDGSAPLLSIDAPLNNAIVSGQVSIDISAFDDFGVDKVEVFIDNVSLIVMFNPPFHTLWNTQSLANDSQHEIKVIAQDVAKNKTTRVVTVKVQNGVQ